MKLINKIALYLYFITFLTTGCNSKKTTSTTDEKPLARVNETYLYISDFKNIFPKQLSIQDSTEFIEKFIEKWIQDELVLAHATENLTKEQLEIEKQLMDYKKNLITYNYQNELIRQKLDTNIGEKEIENYYQQNINEFYLKENIAKVWYVKIKKETPFSDKIKKWMNSGLQKDYVNLKSFCVQNAENYFIEGEKWIFFDDLVKEVPITTANPELYLKSNNFIEIFDSLNIYFVKFKGYRIKNSISPLPFEKENIKNIILNNRKLKLIEEMKKDIYSDAKQKAIFEIY